MGVRWVEVGWCEFNLPKSFFGWNVRRSGLAHEDGQFNVQSYDAANICVYYRMSRGRDTICGALSFKHTHTDTFPHSFQLVYLI